MARNLGQKVALQRLTIDEEITNAILVPHSETPITQLHEKNGEKQPKRDRKHNSSDQNSGGEALSKQDRPTVSGAKRRQKDSVSSGETARRPVSQPERSFSSKERYGRRGVGRQSSFARNTGERKVHTFVASEPQYRTTRRKSRATSSGRIRREGASNRSVGR